MELIQTFRLCFQRRRTIRSEDEINKLTTVDFSCWMGNLDSVKRNIPVNLLAIPGSHDSMSFGISRSSEIAPDLEHMVKVLAKFFGPVVKLIISRWCITQRESIKKQLHLGIRYFDLRIATKKDEPHFYFVHGLYGPNIYGGLNDIVQFLNERAKEVVILDFQHFYSFNEADHSRLIILLKEIFGYKMCPRPPNISAVTLDWMLENKYQIIVIYRNPYPTQNHDLWTSNMWPTPWPNTMDVSELINFLNNRLANRPKGAGFVSQGVLTPQTSTVLKNVFSGVKQKCADPALKALIPWIEEMKLPVNVVIVDFIEMDDAKFPLSKLRQEI